MADSLPLVPKGRWRACAPEGIRTCDNRQFTTPQSAFGCQPPFTVEPYGIILLGFKYRSSSEKTQPQYFCM